MKEGVGRKSRGTCPGTGPDWSARGSSRWSMDGGPKYFLRALLVLTRSANGRAKRVRHYVLFACSYTYLFFLYFYSLLACDLMRSWRDYVQSASCPLSAQWRLVASTPFALHPGLSRECVVRNKEITKGKERRASV